MSEFDETEDYDFTPPEEATEEVDISVNAAVTPHYNEPEDADRYPVAIPGPIPAHTVFKGNPQIDGPYLDDIREAQADARRKANDAVSEIQKKKAEEGQKLLQEMANAGEETE